MSEFREFWIDHCEWYSKEEKEFNDRTCSENDWNASNLIHVIEYAALEQANAKIKELETKLSIAVEALEFYAHADNWNHIEPGTHYVTNIYQCVDKTDYGEGDFTISERMNIDDSGVGGKRARQALKEFKAKAGVK